MEKEWVYRVRNLCQDGEKGFIQANATAENMKAYSDLNFKGVVETIEENRKELEKNRKGPKGIRAVKFVDYIFNKFSNREDSITEKEMEQIYKREFGFKDPKTKKAMGPLAEKMWLITKISMVLNDKDHLQEAFYHEANKILRKYVDKMPKSDSYTLGRTEILETPIPDMVKFPLGAIKELSWMLNDFYFPIKDGDDINYYNGYWGDLQMEFGLTRKATRKTSNPYFIKFVNSVIEKPAVEQAMNRKFMVPADFKDASGRSKFLPNNRDVYRKDDESLIPYANKGKEIKYSRRNHGVNTFYNQVIPISHRHFFENTLADKAELMRMLHLYQQKRLIIKKNGEVWVRNKKIRTKEFHKDSGEPVYVWAGSEPYVMDEKNRNVNDYPNRMNTKKIWDKEKKTDSWVIGIGNKHLKLSPKTNRRKESQISEFIEIANGMQSIFRAFGLNVQSEMDRQSKTVSDTIARSQAVLSKEEFSDLNEMFSIIFEDDMLAVHGLTKFELQEGEYFPVKYTYAMLVKSLGDATIQIEKKINENNDILQTDEIRKDPEAFSAIRKEIIENENTLEYIEQMQKSLANEQQPTDGGVSKNPIFAQNFLKHYKSISNLIDVRNSRLDELVFQDMIDETAKQLNRRQVAINLLDTYSRSFGQPKLQAYMMNLFKTTYQFPDAKGSILGKTHTDEQIKNYFKDGLLSKLKGGQVDVNDYLRMATQFNAANLLSGPADGLVNLISSVQDAIESGNDAFLDAFSEYEHNPTYWEEIAENKGGVITFQKYIENYVDRGLRYHEIAEGRALQKDLKDKFTQLMKDVDILDKKELNKGFKKQWTRIQRDLAILDSKIPSRTKQLLETMAKYAITHKIERSKYVDNPNKLFGIAKVDTITDAMGVYARLPSIALTEKQLRTVSFVIGYKLGQKYLKGLRPTEDDIVNYAREYVFQAQFALETNLAGTKGGTALSKWWYNISFFSTQKTGWELDGHKAWFSQYRDNAHLFMEKQKALAKSGANFDKNVKAPYKAYKSVLKTLLSGVPGALKSKDRKKMINEILPIVNRGEGMFLSFGLASAATNLLLFGSPMTYAGFSAIRRAAFMLGPWRTVVGLNSKLYSAPILAASTTAYLIKSLFGGDEEDEKQFLLEVQKSMRLHTGVGGSEIGTGILKAGDIIGRSLIQGEAINDKLKFSFEKGLYGGPIGSVGKSLYKIGEITYHDIIEPTTRTRGNVNYIRRDRDY